MTRMEVKRKIQSSRGMTLAETLLAVIILLLVSAVVASGIPAAKNAYEKVVLSSNAEMLLSTTISVLRNELGTARGINTPDAETAAGEQENTVVTYYNSSRDSESKIWVDSGSKRISFQRYNKMFDDSYNAYPVTQLISEKVATKDLYVTYDSATYDKATGVIVFNNLTVRHSSDNTALTKERDVSIRLMVQ